MEYYAMPQVDKSASTYSPPVQYVPGIAARSPALVRPEINKFGVSSDILTSCDWSAVIHRPAEESEPEDLPSTVDIDAIKEPTTPLPPLTPCPPNVDDETEDDEDSSDSESEDGVSSSDSDSASQGSGTCRSSSYSDSDSSLSSGKPKDSSTSSSEARDPVPTFSIRETNLEQGGLKLKFSATKSKSNPSQSSSSSDSSSSSSESEEEPKKKLDEGRKSPEVALQRKSVRNVVTPRSSARIVKPSEPSPPEPRGRLGIQTRGAPRGSLRPPPPKATSTAKKIPPKLVKKPQPLRKSPRAKQKNVAAGGESSSQLSSDDGTDDDDEDAEECGDEIGDLARQLGAEDPDLSISEQLQEINQEDLAAILPDVGGSFDGFEEENNGTAGGNAQSSSRHQVTSPAPSHITSSSSSESDTEQIVSDVISRIQDDSESQAKPLRPSQSFPSRGSSTEHTNRSEVGYSSNLLAAFVEKTEILSRGGSAASGSSGSRGNEATSVNIVDVPSSKRKRGRPPKNTKGIAASCRTQNQATGMPELEAYMRMDCSQSNVSPDSGIQSVAGSPAGHHSLPGSPRSPSAAQNSGPPILVKHSPCHSPDSVPSPNDKLTKLVSPVKELKLENGGKRGPGRPKHAFVLNTFGKRKRGKRLRRAEIPKKPIVLPPSAAELKVPPYFAGANAVKCNLPALPQISSKRGRGRPKKSPPVLEPILPLERHKRDASDSSRKCSSIERVPSSERPNLRRNDSDIKSAHSSSSKGLLKNKEHKHKKRKRHSLDFRRLDPAFLRELTRLSETFEKCCVISLPEIKTKPKSVSVEHVERMRQNQRVSSRRRRREKLRKEHMSKSKSSSKPSKKTKRHETPLLVTSKVTATPEDRPNKEMKADKSLTPEMKIDGVEDKNAAKTKKHLEAGKKLPEQRQERKSEPPRNQENQEVSIPRKNENSSKSTRDKEGSFKGKTAVSQTTKDRELPMVISKDESVVQNDTRSPPVLREKTKERNRQDSGSLKEKPQPADSHVKDRGEKFSSGKDKSVEQLLLKDLKGARTPSPVVHKEPVKEKVVLTPSPKEKVSAAPTKDKSQNNQTHSKTDKQPAVTVPNKEKQTLAPTKEKTPAPVLKEKPRSDNKDKVSAPVLKEKPTPSNKEKTTSAPATKEKKENAPAQLTKEKALVANTSAGSPQSAKRRIKKSVVEPPKNKSLPEPASNNEQRLPLKKRHYHMSASASSNSSPGDSGDKSDESSDSSKEVAESREESDASPECLTDQAQDRPSVIEAGRTPDEVRLVATPKKRPCSEPEKKPIHPTKPKEKDVSVKEAVAKRSAPKLVATSVITTVPQCGKRVSSRQAALKQSESQESIKTPPASPLPVKRSQRIKLKHDEQPKEDPKPVEVKMPKDESLEFNGKDVKKVESKSTKEDVKSIKDVQKHKNRLNKPNSKVSEFEDLSDQPALANELVNMVESGKQNDIDGSKRTTRSMDEVAEQKLVDGQKNDKLKLTVDKTATLRSVTPVNTRSSSKASLDAIAADLVDVAKTRSKCDKRSLIGVFEPSVKVVSEILKLPDPQSDVLSKLKTKLLSPFHEFDVEEELKNIKRPMEAAEILSESAEKAKKRKMICDVRVHVTKLDPADLLMESSDISEVDSKAAELIPKVEDDKSKALLATEEDSLKKVSDDIAVVNKDAPLSCDEKRVRETSLPANVSASPPIVPLSNPNKVKMKRKKINRTGFPIKKKKKKRMDVADSAGHFAPSVETVVTTPVEDLDVEAPPPILESKSLEPPQMIAATPPPDKADEASEKSSQLDKTELRPASKRIMELKARNEASERRKRKNAQDDASQDEQDATTKDDAVSDSSTDLKSLVGKRLRKTKEDMDDSDADSVKMRKKQPRWRKKYLPAGLFSDYFKEDEPRKPSANEKVKNTTYSASDHEHGLLPNPAYCTKWVRQRKLPFQLPHDIWWLHTHNQLSGREAVPSWNYKKIRTNVYFDVKPTFTYEAQACNCKPSAEIGCGEECINRMVLTECSSQLCPCREKCSNQKIQRHEWSPGLARFMTKDKGWGVKTKHKILKDRFILEYVGEVVSDREFKNRMASRYQKDTHHYCLNLDGGLVIDGHRMGGDGRFVNHSCEPNCEMQKWCVNGLFRMALFALRDIEPNEELTYDYNFSLFNPSEGQPCKCGSSKCRGVIGGKSQRVALPGASAPVEEKERTGQVGRPRKNPANTAPIGHRRKTNSVDKKISRSTKEQKQSNRDIMNASALASVAARLSHMTTLKPLTQQQKDFIKANRIFLPRNLQRVKRRVEKLKQAVRKGGLLLPDVPSSPSSSAPGTSSLAAVPSSAAGSSNGSSGVPLACVKKEKEGEREVFMTQLNALNCPRSMRTRRLALAEDNPEMTKAARLACLFKDLFAEVTSAKDEADELFSSHFLTLPSKRKFPLYYQRIQKPIDFTTIEQNIVTGVYKTVEAFDDDMNALFKNNIRWYGRTSDLGISATRLRKIYNLAKLDIIPKLEELLGEPPPASFIPAQDDPSGEEEDVIHCICGIFRDEGVMIQCERCLVWQHCYCIGNNSNVENYLCERCSPRDVNYEIPSQEEATDENQTNYITLLRGDMQLKQGDTVYVLRDIVNDESTEVPKAKHTYKTIKNWKYSDCDIFKIERLWKDEKGNRFAFGHHYLRPHETFHEPTRKFFPNELMRVPLYEVVPVELVMGQCYVLDLNTYCKGRPIGCDPDHLYVCEYRVDKNARMFAKIPKPKHSNVCTKSYAFETFDVRLKPQRTYAPHGMVKEDKPGTTSCGSSSNAPKLNVSRGRGGRTALLQADEPTAATPAAAKPARVIKTKPVVKREDRRDRLNKMTLKLLGKLPSKQPPLDLSYLLEPGRRQRKKPPLLAS